MKHTIQQDEIQRQQYAVFSDIPTLHLVAACKIENGIICLEETEKKRLAALFLAQQPTIGFFIPASGSGSRMFEFLYSFLDAPTEENRSQVERFMQAITEFAFYNLLPKEMQSAENLPVEELVSYLLDSDKLSFGKLPKGLVPFHRHGPFILNPFQEHIIQGSLLNVENASFHFTIQSEFEANIRKSISPLENLMGTYFSVSFSEQSPATNSIAFNETKEVVRDKNGDVVTRPAGHGALLANLNAREEEVIFIKNIDNVQHFQNAALTQETWAVLGGLLLDFRESAKEVYASPSLDKLKALSAKFQLYSDSELAACKDDSDILELVNRPARVCGMVRNEGQPGGGPFWVSQNGIVSKQIVEKAQISGNKSDAALMVQSTHFNPVMMAISPYSLAGNKLDFMAFNDPSAYFIVHKKQFGQPIRFMEAPGLWNGGMANWNTLFVEIPSETFSPVKTVLDLLKHAHKA